MKNILKNAAWALTGILGIALAFAGRPKSLSNLVYCQLESIGDYYYSNTPPLGLTCQANVFTACTLSTTATAWYFNERYTFEFPTQDPFGVLGPKVVYLDNNKIYK